MKTYHSDKLGRDAVRYFDALKRIASYQTPQSLRRYSEREYGVAYAEALEMAYENVIFEAKKAIRGKRRPGGNIVLAAIALAEGKEGE